MVSKKQRIFTLLHLQVEQDENTCAVDIVYRQAMGPPAPPSEIPEEPSCQPAQGSLSPIVETSREYYRSSSSSGSDTLHSKTPHGDKSHWGNTQHQVPPDFLLYIILIFLTCPGDHHDVPN